MEDVSLHLAGNPAQNDALSARERQLLIYAANGLTDSGIARELGLSLATVNTYWGRIRIKFGPLSRPELVARFVQGEMARSASALIETEARYQTMVRLAPEAIISVDTTMAIIDFNPGAEKIFGYAADEVLGQPLGILIPEDSRDRHDAYVASFGQDDEATARPMGQRSAVRGQRKGGNTFPCEASIFRQTYLGKTIFTAILRDISSRKD